MSKTNRDCWHCDLCGYNWLILDEAKPPRQCPKCRKTGWNIKVAGSLPADVGRKPKRARGSLTENTGRMEQRDGESDAPARPKSVAVDYAVTPWLDPKEASHLRQFKANVLGANGNPPQSITEWNWFLNHG